MKTPEEKRAYVDERKLQIARYIIGHSVGVVAHDNKKPLEHGTGILLRLEEEPIVLTAAHVVADYRPEQLQLLATRRPINYRVAPSEKVTLGGGMLHLMDVAFLRLSAETAAEIRREREFLPLTAVEVFPQGVGEDLAIVSGFPEEKHEVHGTIMHRYKLETYFPAPLEDVGWVNEAERPTSFTVEYPNETFDALTQEMVSLADPPGMSGGGTWRAGFRKDQPWSPEAIRLIGLNVNVMDGQEVDFIRAIHMEPVLEFLGDHFPSARRYLQQAREELERRRG